MAGRSRLVCASCRRPVPRAAARCPWCAGPVDPVRQRLGAARYPCLSGDIGAAHPPGARPAEGHANRP